MRAVIYRAHGSPDVLEVAEVPDPPMHLDNVLVRVVAAGVNPADAAMRAGLAAASVPAYFPVIPGWEISGVVEAAGIGASEFQAGDEVVGYVRGEVERAHGGYAELISADVRTLAPKPPSLSWNEAAALPLAGLTAYQAIVRQLEVVPGEVVLVHGAAGNVGSLASQMALAAGATVLGVAMEGDHEYLLDMGVVALSPEATADAIVGRHGRPDVVFDTAGSGALDSLSEAWGASTRASSIVELSHPRAAASFTRMVHDDFVAMLRMAGDGVIRPRIGQTYGLERAAEVHAMLEAGQLRGKAILRP